MLIALNSLVVSQDDVRDLSQIPVMVDFVRQGGIFTRQSLERWVAKNDLRPNPPLIGITKFPDGMLMINDGHHRAASILMGGRDHLDKQEFFVSCFTYAEYDEINVAQGWVTPFDPCTQVRLADFGDFKAWVKRHLEHSAGEACAFILDNRSRYSKSRTISTVPELVLRIEAKLCLEAVP